MVEMRGKPLAENSNGREENHSPAVSCDDLILCLKAEPSMTRPSNPRIAESGG
jgi:hypothetical protein